MSHLSAAAADTPDMARLLAFGFVALALSACGNDLDTASPSATPQNQPRDLVELGDVPATDDDANDGADNNDDNDDNDGSDGSDGTDDAGSDDDVDGDDVTAPGPPPAEAGQSCSQWTDCGPNYADPNSGFDCEQNSCVCNSAGNWDDACAQIGGVWSDEECFCFVGAAPMPPVDADEWTADDEDQFDDDDSDPRADRTCWWKWRESCEPDRWVDTGGYEYVCDSGGDCSYEYEDDGYWESGDCSGYWLRRCDDGTEKRF